MKTLPTLLLLLIIACGLFLSGSFHLSGAQTGTQVSGIIGSNVTWTTAGSPYVFTGPVGISRDVTLTINPGVTVNLASYYLVVNGTFQAKGTDTQPIHFNGGTTGMLNFKTLNYAITFAPPSVRWNDQTASGCIIQNAILNETTIAINDASPKIFNNTIDGSIRIQEYSTGSPIIAGNIITGIVRSSGIPDPCIEDDSADYAIISNNTLKNQPWLTTPSVGLTPGANDIVYGNIIYSSYFGIYGGSANAVISNNVISGCQIGVQFYATQGSKFENNLVTNCAEIGIKTGSGPFIIQNNTITNNGVGIQPSASTIISYNNIENNGQSISLVGIQNDVNASNNWWGTTNTQVINQSIFDYKNDFNLGNVIFIPLLTSPNPQATTNPDNSIPSSIPSPTPQPTSSLTPIPSPTPIQTQTPAQTYTAQPSIIPSPSIPEFPTWIILPLILMSTISASLLIREKRKSRKRP